MIFWSYYSLFDISHFTVSYYCFFMSQTIKKRIPPSIKGNVRHKRVVRENPVGNEEFKVRSWNSSIFAPGYAPNTSTLEFKDARTTVACILRSFFRVVSSSARLLAQHASRRIAPRRSALLCPAPEYARRVRACERSPRADGMPDVATHGVAATDAERRAVSLRLPRVATSSLPRTEYWDRASPLCVRDRTPTDDDVPTRDADNRNASIAIDRSKPRDWSPSTFFLSTSRRSTPGPGEVWRNPRVLRGDLRILRILLGSLRVLGEVCEISRDFANTPEATRSIWDISRKFKET